jgi:hypothetical protein
VSKYGVIACVTATLAFWAYTQTLLPGVDLGDTGGFQAAVLWPEVSARQAYPLYHGLARPFVLAASPGNPARALNLFSAIWGAAAVGLLTWLCSTVMRSHIAGVVAGLFLAFSYTFWSQALIAEVYTLHLTLIGLCLLALNSYRSEPSFRRLLVFLAVYALSFGNHLTMILLAIPFAIFLFQTSRSRRDLLHRRVVLAAVGIAALGALQYAPNFMSIWASFSAPDSGVERFAAFWFDTTKQDWRESMVMGVDAGQAADRLAMWLFDSRQQFGVVGLALAAAGIIALWRQSRPWTWLIVTMYAASTIFALTYNVGDSHVFFMPAHFVTAFAAGAGVAGISHLWRGSHQVREASLTRLALLVVAGLALTYAGWRGWTTWPAVDRHDDRRGERLIANLTQGVRDSNAMFVSQMNWQLENVLLYSSRHLRPDLPWVRLGDVMTHWPLFLQDNHRLGRDLVLNSEAARALAGIVDPGAVVEEPTSVVIPLERAFAQVPRGMPYVLVLLAPTRDAPLDTNEFSRALSALTGTRVPERSPASYELFAGIAGDRPQLYRSSSRPFTDTFSIFDERLTVRMDSWLPIDTFRRAGFGHVLRGRRRLMILERGVNLVWLGRAGDVSPPYYAASLFAPQPRFRIPAATLQFARTGENTMD